MSLKHTGGPWRFDGHGINSPKGERICKIAHGALYRYNPGYPVINKCFIADSILVAAAPELYRFILEIANIYRSNELKVPKAKDGRGNYQLARKIASDLLDDLITDARGLMKRLEEEVSANAGQEIPRPASERS